MQITRDIKWAAKEIDYVVSNVPFMIFTGLADDDYISAQDGIRLGKLRRMQRDGLLPLKIDFNVDVEV